MGESAINTLMGSKELHDELLRKQPSGAEHDTASCPYCAPEGANNDSLEGGGDNTVSDNTFTKEELDAAVADATQPLEAKLRELEQAAAQSDADAQRSQEVSELIEQVKELEAKLDSAVLEAQEAKKTNEDVAAYLDSVEADKAAEAEKAARREERLATVREVANFPEEHIESRADAWTELSDEDFEALVNDWRAVAAAQAETGTDEKDDEDVELPADTAIDTAGRDSAASQKVPAYAAVMEMTMLGNDPRTL